MTATTDTYDNSSTLGTFEDVSWDRLPGPAAADLADIRAEVPTRRQLRAGMSSILNGLSPCDF